MSRWVVSQYYKSLVNYTLIHDVLLNHNGPHSNLGPNRHCWECEATGSLKRLKWENKATPLGENNLTVYHKI